ncbi:CDP-alcohol phosphatidyltransferase family protein [Novibacillus thermophilus]|uniref:CDP-alcohol phosphatidyltransferase n=1 Tax=Novibacillus thermophilus TaxID=1471761 RepID=A0A1U9KAQ9_9BACL|nr:CDP-alcohol phosphatidyltransferase family protein [Novibacillus thermophilus]AQS57120.1 CDP-alcohol phosphatidyltransferase [Novibacillus thermophilus]
MTDGKYTLSDVHSTYKAKDAWWTVLFVDPIASRLVVPVANYTNITPNQISIVSFIVGMIAAYSFYVGSTDALLTGAILYHISFILDCMDGKIARLKGNGSMFGVLLDIMLDHIRVIVCGVALTVGQFQLTGDHTFLFLALLFMFVYFFRHYNALTLYKLRRQMRGKIKKARANRNKEEKALVRAHWLHTEHWIDDSHPASALKEDVERAERVLSEAEEKVRRYTEGRVKEDAEEKRKIDLQQAFKSKFPRYLKIREMLLRNRIRMHLFSGIEFQMFIFIIAPIVGFIPEIILFSSALLFMFELAIIYKLWLSTKDFEKELAKIQNR